MTHSKVSKVQIAIAVASLVAVATTSLATAEVSPSSVAPYADYITYVTAFRSRTTGEAALAVAKTDPAGTRCFAQAADRAGRELCQRYLQEKALVEALPAIANAARAKLVLDADPGEPSRDAMLPLGLACADAADRLAETGIAPLRKIGPYTIGLLKSKLCNALVVASGERVANETVATEH
ncbi:MAG: hypothetical protein ACKV2T_38510 [Kofleriaceae bacterium]